MGLDQAGQEGGDLELWERDDRLCRCVGNEGFGSCRGEGRGDEGGDL